MIVGIGIDLVEIERAQRMLDSLGEKMLTRLFSVHEAEYIRSKPAPAQHAAVRLAAKEAAFKALAGSELARRIGWRDVEVVTRLDGAPTLLLSGAAAERAAEAKVATTFVSLSHERGVAIAMVVLESA